MKISKKWKKCLEISSFNTSVPKILITCFSIPEVWCVTYVIVTFHFELFFALLTLLIAQKITISKNWKHHLDISSFYTCVPKIMIICYTVPEIWCMTVAIVIFHFGPIFALLPLNSLKNQNFKKMKKAPRDIIISHKYTKNQDHMLYCSWDMAYDGCNCYFSFWAIFCHLTAQKMKISKKMKKEPGDIIVLQLYQKSWSYTILFRRYGAWQM